MFSKVIRTGLPSVLLISIFSMYGYANEKKDVVSPSHVKNSYGVVVLNSQMPDLKITIDQEDVGLTQKDINQTFTLKGQKGTAEWGNHEIILVKDINKTHEWYFRKTFSFLTDEPLKKVINIFTTEPKMRDYPPRDFQITKRIKPAALAQKSGLIKELKLQHNSGAYNMSVDDKYIYVKTDAKDALYDKQAREKNTGEYLEIYDINTYELVQYIKLGEEPEGFDNFLDFATDENFIYLGTKAGYGVCYSTNSKIKRQSLLDNRSISRHNGQLSTIKLDGKNLFTLGEDGKVGVYELSQDKQFHFAYMINTHKYYTKNYLELDDKRGGHLFDIVIHNNVAYISSDIGTIFKFDIRSKPAKFIGTIDTIYKEDGKYYASDIKSMQIYKDRYLMFATEYRGVSLYDTLTSKMVYENKNLYPKTTYYSEHFKEELDSTERTNIYKFFLYKDNLIFTEFKPQVVVYNMTKKKIVHTFEGVSDDISDIERKDERLFSLSTDGKIYVWDLNKLEE